MVRLAALALISLLSTANADCPKGCPKRCPVQYDIQSPFMHEHFDIEKLWGVYYELALHDSTQPTYPFLTAACQRSVKTPHPDNHRKYKDLFSMRVGPFGGTNAVCDLEFDLTDKPGVLQGHWSGNSWFNPNLANISNTIVDVGVSPNGTYTWTLEFQCKEFDDPEKGVRFAAVNFYHKNPLVEQEEFDEMMQRLRARGLGWIVDVSPGLHMVDQKKCIDGDSYPALDAKTAFCGQGSSFMNARVSSVVV